MKTRSGAPRPQGSQTSPCRFPHHCPITRRGRYPVAFCVRPPEERSPLGSRLGLRCRALHPGERAVHRPPGLGPLSTLPRVASRSQLPQDGHVTTQRWADPDKWLRSQEIVHKPLVDELTFRKVQALVAKRGRDEKGSERSPKVNSPYVLSGRTSFGASTDAKHNSPYVLSGRVICALCGRKMSGHKASGGMVGYHCRIRADYALPSTDPHPPTSSPWLSSR